MDEILTPGGQARIYQRGMLKAAVLVPHGRMEVRELAPGDYLAVDEGGHSIEFIVSSDCEVAVVQIPEGADTGPVASAETPHDVDLETGETIFPDLGTVPADEDADADPPARFTHDPKAQGSGPHYPDEHPPLARRTDERGDVYQGMILAEQEGRADPVPAEVVGELEEMRVADLRATAKAAGVVQKGTKDELKERIRAALEPADADVLHSGEATADEPSAEEQLEDQGDLPEPTPVPTDGVFIEGTDQLKDEHHLEGGSSAGELDQAARERAAVQRKMDA